MYGLVSYGYCSMDRSSHVVIRETGRATYGYEGVKGLNAPAFGQDGEGVGVEFGDCALQVGGQVVRTSTSALEARLRLK